MADVTCVPDQALDLDLGCYDGVALRVLGDGQTFKLNLKTADQEDIPESTYQATFDTIEGAHASFLQGQPLWQVLAHARPPIPCEWWCAGRPWRSTKYRLPRTLSLLRCHHR